MPERALEVNSDSPAAQHEKLNQMSQSSDAHHNSTAPRIDHWIRGAILVIAVAALSILSPAAQAATATWTPETVLASHLQGASRIATAVSPSGRSVVVWDQLVGVDPGHPYGIYQVYASVRASNGGAWSAPAALSAADAYNAGATVDPLTGKVTVFWTSLDVPYAASSTNSGAAWSSGTIPGNAGFTLLTTVYSQVGPFVDADGAGNVTVIMIKPRAGSPVSYDVEALVRASNGIWGSPISLTTTNGVVPFGSAHLNVLSDGQALLNFGFTTFRRDGAGNWGPAQAVNIAGMGQIYSASAALDAAGKGYFVYRTHYLGAFISTSTPGAAGWSKPRHIAKFDQLGSSLLVAASSAGHAIVYGNDTFTGAVRATATSDGAKTWGPLVGLGIGYNPQAVGSENGQFALSYNVYGATADRFIVASGTGLGTAATAWTKKSLAGGFASGSVAIAGSIPGGNAQAVAGWVRTAGVSGEALGAATGTLSP